MIENKRFRELNNKTPVGALVTRQYTKYSESIVYGSVYDPSNPNGYNSYQVVLNTNSVGMLIAIYQRDLTTNFFAYMRRFALVKFNGVICFFSPSCLVEIK